MRGTWLGMCSAIFCTTNAKQCEETSQLQPKVKDTAVPDGRKAKMVASSRRNGIALLVRRGICVGTENEVLGGQSFPNARHPPPNAVRSKSLLCPMARPSALHDAAKAASLVVGISASLSLIDSSFEPAFITRTLYQWLAHDRPDYYILNWVELILFAGCTAFVVEGLMRRTDQAWQFTLEEASGAYNRRRHDDLGDAE